MAAVLAQLKDQPSAGQGMYSVGFGAEGRQATVFEQILFE
jgi:hypothetical protein